MGSIPYWSRILTQIHQGKEIIAIVALENGAFCTVFSEIFHNFSPSYSTVFFPSQCMSLLYKISKI
jgi:hypothetical protein